MEACFCAFLTLCHKYPAFTVLICQTTLALQESHVADIATNTAVTGLHIELRVLLLLGLYVHAPNHCNTKLPNTTNKCPSHCVYHLNPHRQATCLPLNTLSLLFLFLYCCPHPIYSILNHLISVNTPIAIHVLTDQITHTRVVCSWHVYCVIGSERLPGNVLARQNEGSPS